MRSDFKIEEPDFVSRSKQSAVAAVEARFSREEAQRRKMERRSRAKSCLAWLLLLSMAAVAGLYFAARHYGIGAGEVTMRVHEAITSRRYARIEERFRTAPLAYWQDAPEAILPNKVATNTVYHALLPDGDARLLLELTAVPGGEMKIRVLSPLADPVSMPLDDFTRLAARTPYLVAFCGNVYFCSRRKMSIDKEDFRRRLFSGRQDAPKKGR